MTHEIKPRPMYFASLEVENVKSFGTKQTLDLRDSKRKLSRWTLILGDNGVGKTTLLKCLAWMLPEEFAEPERFQLAKKLKDKGDSEKWIKELTKITDKEWELIAKKDPNKKTKRITPILDSIHEDDINAIVRVGKGVKMDIEIKFTDGTKLDEIPEETSLITIGISLERKANEELDEIQEIENTDHLTTAEVEEFNTPNLFAYGAARHMAAENLDTLDKNTTYNLLSRSGDLLDAEEGLLKLYNDSLQEDNAKLKETIERYSNGNIEPLTGENLNTNSNEPKGKAGKHLKNLKGILAKLLPYIENPDCIIINQSTKKEGQPDPKVVEVKTPFGNVGLYDLSLGYQTMLAWVVDLAIRMYWQNPESENPLDEPAVVIVDEIDLHLHPKWQRTLKEYLTGNFKGTQFICTTHSPFMAQASGDANLCVLHEIKLNSTVSEVFIENDPVIVKNWHIGQIVTNLFDVSEFSFSEVEEKLINRRRVLLDKEQRTPQEEEEIKQLHEQILNLPGYESEEDRKLLDQIRKTAELIRQKGGMIK